MTNNTININFHFQQTITLKNRRKLKSFLANNLQKAGKNNAILNIIFCSDEELLEINRTHLNHDYYTDIITFDLSETGSDQLVSDIFISTDRVKDNAGILGVNVENELHRVIFHGILHLLGFKDKSAVQQKEMRAKEEEWLNAYQKDLFSN